jgi:hypothetical protein
MEIRIAYHQTSETLLNSISRLFKENGMIATIQNTNDKGEVRISVADKEQEAQNPNLLESSFVVIDSKPGY